MITGVVKFDEARIRLKVRGQRRREQEIEAVIDSGFTAALTLPPALISRLGLRWRSMEQAILADGSTCAFQVYAGKVLWNGKTRNILIGEANTVPLVGMRLLRGHELRMQVRARGRVTIKRLSRRRRGRS